MAFAAVVANKTHACLLVVRGWSLAGRCLPSPRHHGNGSWTTGPPWSQALPESAETPSLVRPVHVVLQCVPRPRALLAVGLRGPRGLHVGMATLARPINAVAVDEAVAVEVVVAAAREG